MQKKPKNYKAVEREQKSGVESRLDQIEKLNGLLEKGYITKEEFDNKKKQIMQSDKQ